MLTLLKDIFWQDQYRAQTETKTQHTGSERLDRDRYFIGLALLSALLFVSLYAMKFIYPYEDYFMDDGYRMFNLIANTFSPNLILDPIALILSLMLSRRAFGRWLALPVGLVSYTVLSLASMAPYIGDQELFDREMHVSLLIMLVIALVWLIFQLLMLARPALKNSQPNHPLVRLNPDHPADKQYTAVQYMWRFILLGCVMLLCSVLFSVGLYLVGYYLNAAVVYAAMIAFGLGVMLFTLMILVRRLRNLGKKPLPWLLGMVLVPSAYMGLQGYLHSENFFNLMPLFTLMLILVGLMRLVILFAQTWLLIGEKTQGAAVSDMEDNPTAR